MKFIAGEELKTGDYVRLEAIDGKVYRWIKGQIPIGYAPHNVSIGEEFEIDPGSRKRNEVNDKKHKFPIELDLPKDVEPIMAVYDERTGKLHYDHPRKWSWWQRSYALIRWWLRRLSRR